ncbi:MAG: site-2 protease family protein, partial [Akkermansiaceae bacterium]|nr:site-2 protease family protein [Armatimonadota bacterium]
FNNRPIYQRFWVILGGPLFSFLFGWLALCLLGATFGIPEPRVSTVIEQVVPNRPAAVAGLKAGDKVISINDKPINNGNEMIETLHDSPNKPLTISVRDARGTVRTVNVTPDSGPDPEGKRPQIGLIGIRPTIEPSDPKRVSLSESFEYGNRFTGFWFIQMGRVLSTPKELGASVGGPVAILKQSNNASREGGSSIVSLLGQLSLSLGLFNLFPIPILDGGHLALMALEKARGRKLTAEQTNRVFTVGFILMASLFVVILFKDIFGR